MRIYFLRHGESEANRLRVLSNRDLPHPLTALGREQARAAIPHVADCTGVYTSPVPRARETAEIIAAALGLPVTVTPALREFDCGCMEGRGDEEAWGEWRRVWRAWAAGDLSARVEGGECFHDVRDRFVPFVEDLARSATGTPLLVGHGGLFMAALPEVLQNVDRAFAHANPAAHALPVVAESAAGNLRCLSWCGVPFPA